MLRPPISPERSSSGAFARKFGQWIIDRVGLTKSDNTAISPWRIALLERFWQARHPPSSRFKALRSTNWAVTARHSAITPAHSGWCPMSLRFFPIKGCPTRCRRTCRRRSLRCGGRHSRGPRNSKIRQNLALVIGLQGRFAEAETIVRADLSPEEAAQNVAYLRRMIAERNDLKKLSRPGGALAPSS